MSQNASEITSDKTEEALSSDQHESPSSDEKIEKIRIVLDNPQNTYCSGQTVNGKIYLNCTRGTQIRGKLQMRFVVFRPKKS